MIDDRPFNVYRDVEDDARADRVEALIDRDERPTRAELAQDDREYEAWLKDYRAGRIRAAAIITGPLCERRPDERLSACVLREGHEGGCVFVRLTRDRHGGAYYRIPPGAATPEQVHEIRTRYREPSRVELAHELEWLKVYRVVPATFDGNQGVHRDRPF